MKPVTFASSSLRVVDFLILMLRTQAEAMNRLKDLFSEDILMQIIERREDKLGEEVIPEIDLSQLDLILSADDGSTGAECYGEIETAVNAFKLTERIEFYLWSYVPYRSYIESSIDLSAHLKPASSGASSVKMVEDAIIQGTEWLSSLGIQEPFASKVMKEVAPVWTAFRAEAMRRLGRGLRSV